ncbi:MAG: MFS transporter [Alphaproteobacteria bacterium]|nr:MFS transporter [Alphaproteobacteria bacterium]
MAVSRASVVDANFSAHVRGLSAGVPRVNLDAPVRDGAVLRARDAIRLFEAQIESRHLDLIARALKGRNLGYYTIGSSGHEGNAAVGGSLRQGDMSFLHYRSGAYFCARAALGPGPNGAFDVLRGMLAASDEPIAGGRHKVFGSVDLDIPPQTSTIASQLPKALGYAVALDRKARREGRKERRVSVVTFGDASANHATAQTAFNAAGWSAFQNVPAPVLFVCEDNGFGISVRTPRGWIETAFRNRAGLPYYFADGLDLCSAWEGAQRALAYVRESRRPAFLHMRTVRMLGHAGSDVEQLYKTNEEIEAAEALDPLLTSATLLVENGWLTPGDVLDLYEGTRTRLERLAEEAIRRPTLTTAKEVMEPLFTQSDDARVPLPSEEERERCFPRERPEDSDRPRHLAVQLNRALTDILSGDPRTLVFGEDVARKGGVYHVTADLTKKFGVGRVFNTLLDETTILGLAIGAGHAGMLPMPEIQYLAYLINAIDQLRGEAGSMQFFSNGQYANPMVVRIASLGYQKGFGGHFHNDNGIAAVREIPGILIGCPARGDDAARMLRTLTAQAGTHGRLTVMLEPIALYMTKDLYEDGDNLWLTSYPAPDDHMPLGEVRAYGEGTDLCIATFANGLWMSLRVAKKLEAEGYSVRVVDLRWLQPLPIESLLPHARAAGKVLVVDECRASSGVADTVVAGLVEREPTLRTHRVTGLDTYIPLGDAANRVLVQEPDIEAGARLLLGGEA